MQPSPSASSVTVAVGAGALFGAGSGAHAPELVLDLGPDHPSTHGGMRLGLTLDGDRIRTADPRIGFVHRGAEKLFEARDYRQILMLANRHDWLSAFGSELGVVLAVERMMGLAVPPRAVWLRTLLAELNRAAAGLAFLGAVPGDDGTPVAPTTAAREALLAVFEEVSGGRVHFMFNRVGGLKEDLPEGWTARCSQAVRLVAEALPDLAARFAEPAVRRRLAGVGPLPAALVGRYGLSGPVARASGVPIDLRRDDPYLAYAELDVRSSVAGVGKGVGNAGGDCAARLDCLLGDVTEALRLVEVCLERMPAGAVSVRLPKAVRVPEGATYAWTENPLGINGYYLVSRGGVTPWRLKLRTASFATLSALPALLPGTLLADLPTVLASLLFVLGDSDR